MSSNKRPFPVPLSVSLHTMQRYPHQLIHASWVATLYKTRKRQYLNQSQRLPNERENEPSCLNRKCAGRKANVSQALCHRPLKTIVLKRRHSKQSNPQDRQILPHRGYPRGKYSGLSQKPTPDPKVNIRNSGVPPLRTAVQLHAKKSRHIVLVKVSVPHEVAGDWQGKHQWRRVSHNVRTRFGPETKRISSNSIAMAPRQFPKSGVWVGYIHSSDKQCLSLTSFACRHHPQDSGLLWKQRQSLM